MAVSNYLARLSDERRTKKICVRSGKAVIIYCWPNKDACPVENCLSGLIWFDYTFFFVKCQCSSSYWYSGSCDDDLNLSSSIIVTMNTSLHWSAHYQQWLSQGEWGVFLCPVIILICDDNHCHQHHHGHPPYQQCGGWLSQGGWGVFLCVVVILICDYNLCHWHFDSHPQYQQCFTVWWMA